VTIKAHEFDRIVDKLGFDTRDSRDRLAWLSHNGRIIVRTKRSKQRGTDLPFQHSIRQQLKFTDEQLRAVIDCTIGREEYLVILRAKGLLPP
jgi:hypothetical protein